MYPPRTSRPFMRTLPSPRHVSAGVILLAVIGYLTSVAFSPSLGHSVALGFVKDGARRRGEIVRAVNPLKNAEVDVEIVSPHFIDPEGTRLRA